MKFEIIPPFKAVELAANLDPNKTLGIEVTVPAVAAKCGLGNIDHHRPGDTSATPSACEQAMTAQVPPVDAVVVGVLGDADTLSAMAVLKIRAEIGQERYADAVAAGENVLWDTAPKLDEFPQMAGLVERIGLIDRFGPNACGEFMQDPAVKAIRAVAGRRDLSTEDQVRLIAEVVRDSDLALENNPKLQDYVQQANAAYEQAKAASKVQPLGNGVVFVESKHQMATQIGYEKGDVVIALNPEMPKDFKNPEAGTYRKFTVCKRDDHVPIKINFDKLNQLESGWGGRPTIGGSPQGEDSKLTVDQVASCLERQPIINMGALKAAQEERQAQQQGANVTKAKGGGYER